MEIGNFVKDKKTNQIGIIIDKYNGDGNFDFEVFAIKQPFSYGNTWQDCFKKEELQIYNWEDFPKTIWQKLILLLKLKRWEK